MAVELRFENGVFRLLDAEGNEHRRPVQAGDVQLFGEWTRRYDQAVQRNNDEALLTIGTEIHAWFDARGLEALRGDDRDIRFATAVRPDAEQQAFLDVPWELVADRHGFWAQDALVRYQPTRLLGRPGKAAMPAHADLFVLFMAAAPAGEAELDFEAEEVAILAATRTLPVQVTVEESGALGPLSETLALGAPYESLHLSCHGGVTEKDGAVLAFEDVFGDRDWVTSGRLASALGDIRPLLVFLSACRTAEYTAGSMPLALDLVRARVPNVVGWDGSVYDKDAIAFAQCFYGELAKRRTVPSAAAMARRHLLTVAAGDRSAGRHWHLARVYVGASGCGILSDAARPQRQRPGTAGHQTFLDRKSKVKVASPEEFVGRRRETQRVLRELGPAPWRAGVLIHGMGRLGKSSLAARVSQRLPHHKVAVVFGEQPGQYEAMAIFSEVVEALPSEQREDVRQRWGDAVRAVPRRLKDALEAVLTGPAAVHEPGAQRAPLLLVIDDLERILETPAAGQQRTQVRAELRDALRDVIRAFDSVRGQTESRLILTSRYLFTLPGSDGTDLADRLFELQLPPMNERQRTKLAETEARLRGPNTALKPEEAERVDRLLARAAVASGGNPGLQALLNRATRDRSTLDIAESAIGAVERYRDKHERPTGGDLGQFFVQLALDTYRNALSSDETALMRAALVFHPFAVPWQVMEAAGRAAGVDQPAKAIERLLGLGCMDAFLLPGQSACEAQPEVAVNALARPLYEPLTEAERRHLAQAVVEPLYAAWADDGRYIEIDERAKLLFSLAMEGNARREIVNESATLACFYCWQKLDDTSSGLAIVEEALRVLDEWKGYVNLYLIRCGVECAYRQGETERAQRLMDRGLASPGSDALALAMLRGAFADQLARRGKLVEALRIRREEELPIYERLGLVRERALTMGKIGDILFQRGELNEALRIWQEEELPVYERLGDVHSRAVTMGSIADILFDRGELDKALRIRQEEELPVYERLGDVRSRAVTMGKIADILFDRGERDEALRIREEEELPVYERLGDVRERAMTMGKIADIRFARGELDEALRIRREEQLPVYGRLGDVRERALTMGRIADILFARGKLDEALRIRKEEELPVYEQLGDVRSRAGTMGQIADILFARGELGAALRIRRKEQLPVYERLGDVRARTVTMSRIAGILLARGEWDEALRIHLFERLPLALSLNDIASIAHIRYECARIRLQVGMGNPGALRTILDELGEAYELSRKVGRADFIANVGSLLGKVLLQQGQAEHAIDILHEAAQAFRMLGQQDRAEAIETMIAKAKGANK